MEMGGLTWGGEKNKDGKILADGHLSFDQYMQDQICSIDAGREGEGRCSAMTFSDRGDYSTVRVCEDIYSFARGCAPPMRICNLSRIVETVVSDLLCSSVGEK
jgi:hypothetical protein